jgi:MFS family permease
MEPVESIQSKPSISAPNKNLILFIICIVNFFVSFAGPGFSVAIPAIGRDFNSNVILLNWVITISQLTAGVFAIPAGRIADMFGLKKIFILGLSIYLPFTILTVLSTNIYMLLGCQVIQAIGLAMIFPTTTAIISAVFPSEERGKALGIVVGILYFGFSLSPLVCGFLTENFGWRSIFLLAVPGCLAAFILVLWKVKQEWVHSRGEKYDYTGSVIYAISLISLLLGFSVLPEMYGFILILAGVTGMVIFFRWENRVSSPVFNTSLFRNNRIFLFSNLTTFISYTAASAVTYLLSLYLQYNKGLTPEHAGLVIFAEPLMQAVFSPLSGWLSDKVEPRIVVSVGMGLICLGLIPFIFVTSGTPLIMIIIPLVVLGMGFGIFSSPNTNAVMSSVSPENLGIASATLSTMRTLGILLSMAITMVIMSVMMGRVVITQEYYGIFLNCVRVAFGIFSVFCLAGVFLSLARGKLR